MHFNWEDSINKKNIKPFNPKTKFMDKENNMICPNCSYKYLTRDIFIMIIEQLL